ncbi:hypothetical protein GTZ99_15985 [Novosphingobium sp. FSY-8]|uniref:Peptidase YpeB-like protein n=2 Tax=Novosphingobium ovatum TaxID=1908523 RepID=A0ABW9XHN3_9SPHN|nr:hypothetical protein [Novosphingobium ovatum]
MATVGLAGALALAGGAPAAAQAGPDRSQGMMRLELRMGRVLPLREIERRVVPMLPPGTEYLGPEYDPAAIAYRLKFIIRGRVMFIDIDARTGEVIRRSF